MGFRTGAYATVWETSYVSDANTKGRISISRRDKRTGEWVDDFTNFVSFLGTSAARKAATLQRRDRIRLGDVDVSSTYDKEKQQKYYNFNIFSFDLADQAPSAQAATSTAQSAAAAVDRAVTTAGDGDIDDSGLPF